MRRELYADLACVQIKKKNDQTVLKYGASLSSSIFFRAQGTDGGAVEPNAMDKDASKLVTTTVRDYDLQETSKLMRAVYFGVAMMAFMHLYMGCVSPSSLRYFILNPNPLARRYTQPLFIQALMGIKGLYDAKPVAIHVLGRAAEGDLKRPFKAGGMFGAASDPQTDKAAIDEAEKRVGKKEE